MDTKVPLLISFNGMKYIYMQKSFPFIFFCCITPPTHGTVSKGIWSNIFPGIHVAAMITSDKTCTPIHELLKTLDALT